MILDISGKVVVVTGASRGIGRELAIALAKEGACVVANYFVSQDKAESLLAEMKKYSSDCMIFKADVTNFAEVKKMYHAVVEQYGKVDVLINNAGICDDNLLQMMSCEQWNRVVNTNLYGTFICCKVFTKWMIHQKSGQVINIASLKGQIGCEGQVNYSASKGGMISMTKTLAKELGVHNIAVNAVCPGFIVTDLNRHNEQKKIIAKKKSVLQDIESALDDTVNFIVYAISDKFVGVSGQVFNLDSRVK